jgi:hypothetical protein
VPTDATDGKPVVVLLGQHPEDVGTAVVTDGDEVGELVLANPRRQLPHLDLDAHDVTVPPLHSQAP